MLPYLYVHEYGFHAGNILWSGYFTRSTACVYLNMTSATAFGFSTYLNAISSYRFRRRELGTVYSHR